MTNFLRVLVILPAILFVVTGLRWAIDPQGAAAFLGMTMMDGLGRSSQIADVGALFLSMGLMILMAVVTSRRSWFYAPALMLAVAATYRILAWLFHGAPLATEQVTVEVIITLLLLFAATRLSKPG